MEPVAAQALLFILARKGKAPHERIDRLVESGVETANLWQVRLQGGYCTDGRETARLMQRSKRRKFVDGVDDVWGQTDRFDELASAMHDAMAGADQVSFPNFALHPIQHLAYGRVMPLVGGERPIALPRSVGRFCAQCGFVAQVQRAA